MRKARLLADIGEGNNMAQAPADFSPLGPTTVECPYAYYEAMRSQAPVFRAPGHEWFLVSRYELAVEVLMDPARFSSASGVGVPAGPHGQHPPDPSARTQTLLTADPPVHAHYRTLVNRAFSTRRVASMETDVREVAEALVATFPGAGAVEIGDAYGVPLPLIVICDMLGLPREHLRTFKKWSDGIAQLGGMVGEDERREIRRNGRAFAEYLLERVEERRRDPRDDIMTDLVTLRFTAPDGVERALQNDEILSILPQLLVAGNETTTNTITSGLLLLIEHPDQLAMLRQDPKLVANFVDEVLRLESPVQCHFRRATADTVLAGVAIPAGAGVGVLFGSANRDDQHFPAAASLDVRRANSRSHLAFGQGIHFCVGAPLARLEARVAFEVLLEHFSDFELAPGRNDLRHVPSFTHRGLRELWVELDRT